MHANGRCEKHVGRPCLCFGSEVVSHLTKQVLIPCRCQRNATREQGSLYFGISGSKNALSSRPNLGENGLTLVPPTKIPPRAPFGPSEAFIAGMFFSGMAFVLQKSAAVRRDTCKMHQQPIGRKIWHIPK